jgi:hypothetical protein
VLRGINNIGQICWVAALKRKGDTPSHKVDDFPPSYSYSGRNGRQKQP